MNYLSHTTPKTIRRYNIVRVLGYSTFGVVYEVLDKQLSADDDPVYCAINLICKAGRPVQELDTIRRKIALHSSISSHPSIVTVYDSWEDDEYICVVLDWESGTLAERIGAGAYAGNDELVRSVFLSLVDAVEACHHAGIAYRDLKPEKILVDGKCTRVYLADFGLATDLVQCSDFWAGSSLTHMAPECYGPASYHPHQSDIWALGLLLVNLIGGMSPWTEALFKDPLFSRFCDDPSYLRRCTPISDEAHTLVKRMLAYDPVQRISLGQLRAAVKAIEKFFDYDVRRMGFRPVPCSVRNGAADPEVDATADAASGIPGRSSSSMSPSDSDRSSGSPDLRAEGNILNTPVPEEGNVNSKETRSPFKGVGMPPTRRNMEEDGWRKGAISSRTLAANL